MKHFDYITAAKGLLTPRTTTLLSAIHEAKGRQSVQAAIRPDLLNTLIAVARIQSTNASNRIEGISTSDKRLNALVAGKTTPHNRAEEEITGYRDVLATIHESHDYIPPTPNTILQLHRDLFRYTGLAFGGHFKDSDNAIIERDATGKQIIRFTPQTHSSHRSSSSAPVPPIQKPSKTDISIHCSPQQCSPSTSPASTHSMTAMVE